MSKKLAIIIVNWNSYDLTHDTLVSLSNTTYTNYNIIVVDNCSEDGSGEKLKENFSNIILLQSTKNNGFTGGNNIGMQYAIEHGYENVLLLNNDVAVAPNFIEPLLQKLASHENIAAVQPLIYFHHNHELIWNAGSKYNALLICFKSASFNGFCSIFIAPLSEFPKLLSFDYFRYYSSHTKEK